MVDDDWLPASAAALVVGAVTLLVGSALSTSGDGPAATITAVQQQGGQWLASAWLYFLGAVLLVIGLPALLTAAPGRGRTWVRSAAAVLALGYVGVAGLASLLVLVRSLVVVDAIDRDGLERVGHEPGLLVFLFGWVAAFYLGEVLLAVGLLRAPRADVPVWIPVLLLLHVTSLAASEGPAWIGKAALVLLVLPLCGIGITVAQRSHGA